MLRRSELRALAPPTSIPIGKPPTTSSPMRMPSTRRSNGSAGQRQTPVTLSKLSAGSSMEQWRSISPEALIATLAHALLREDAGFHAYQMLEAGVRQFREWGNGDQSRHILIAVARYLAAHFPTRSEEHT